MYLSISTKLYCNYTLQETIRRVAALGYPAIEIWGGRPHAYYRDMDGAALESVRAELEKTGITISGFIPAQFGYPTNLCSPIESIRTDSVAYIRHSIDTSLALGCKKVSLCPGRTLYGQGYRKGMEQLTASLDQLAAYALQKDVLLLLEPAHMLESDLVMTVEEGIRLIESRGYQNMGIALDTGHCHVNKESLADAVGLLKSSGIPMHIHLDDNNTLADQHKIPGEGTICFVPFLQALTRAGYQGALTVELGFDYTSNPDAAAYQSREKVLALLRQAKETAATTFAV